MKKRRFFSGIISLILVVCAIAGVSLLLAKSPAYAAELTEEVQIASHYILGERFSAPARSFMVNGKEYSAEISFRYPSGTVIRANSILFTEVGKYILTYSCTVSGKTYSDSMDIIVKRETYQIDGTKGYTDYDESDGTMVVFLGSGESFCYNVPIDLSGKTANDEIISLYLTASQTGVRDIQTYYIVLTDLYDSSKKEYIRVTAADKNQFVTYHNYVDGFEPYEYTLYSADAGMGLSGGTTTRVHQSFSNESKRSNEEDYLSFRYDDLTKSIYISDNNGSQSTPIKIGRLESEFTENKCYISVYVSDVETSDGLMNMTIKSITDFTKDTVTDEESFLPEITVDYGVNSASAIPCGIVGQPYSIFEASATILNVPSKAPTVKVYYNYNASNRTLVPTSNGCFIPTNSGEYTIVYTASNSFGMASTKELHINVLSSVEDLEFKVKDFACSAGVKTEIPGISLISADDRLGLCNLTVYMQNGEINDLVYNGLLEDYSSSTYTFLRSGEWQAVYTLSDYVRSVTYSAKVDVTHDKNIIYEEFDELNIQEYMISGSGYILPTVNVVSYIDGGMIVTPAKIKIIYGSDSLILEDNIFIPDYAKMGDDVTIVYYDPNDESIKIEGECKIINMNAVAGIDMSKLFLSDTATISSSSSSLTITANADSVIELINKQEADGFTFKFKPYVDMNSSSFGQFDIILTDSENDDIQIRIKIKNLNGTSSVSIEGSSTTATISNNFTDKTGVYFTLSYTANKKIISIADANFNITKCVNGDSFAGFTSGSVKVSFEMKSVSGTAIVDLFAINNQALTNYTKDNVKPLIIVNGSYPSLATVGSVLNILPAEGIDVISGYCNATVSVRLRGGDYLKTADGTEMKNLDATKAYSVVLDQNGDYLVQYNTVDASGNAAAVEVYLISVPVTEAPAITISNTQTTASVGDGFKMPTVKLEDGASAGCTIFVMIVDSDDVYTYLGENDNYIFENAGKYKVIVCVFDEVHNLSRSEYLVEVK